jgi:hypothetical protein
VSALGSEVGTPGSDVKALGSSFGVADIDAFVVVTFRGVGFSPAYLGIEIDTPLDNDGAS